MYTGIVQGVAEIDATEALPGLSRLTVSMPQALMADLSVGASVGLDGVCMTVTGWQGCLVSFDAMEETLAMTTLGQLQAGDRVNVERSAKQNAEIGGHLLSGHIDGMAQIVDIERRENNWKAFYRLPAALSKYVFKKGFVAVNGCSLTVVDMDDQTGIFSINFIPETLRATTHGERQVGDRVNIEVDRQTQVIVDTVERVLARQ